jgi:A1 cistron-splicing factor AAR2
MPASSALEAGLADPDAARAAASTGGALLLLDVPAGTALTLDGRAFLAGPAFKGVKMLPPGPHYVTYAAVGVAGGGGGGVPGPVASFWVWVELAGGTEERKQTVTIRRWNPATELLDPLADEDEEARYAAGVARFDFDAGLAPYALPTWPAWRALAGHVDARAIARLAPVGVAGGTMSVVAEADPAGLGGLGAAGSGGGGMGGGGGAPAHPTPAEAALEAALAAGRAARGSAGGGDGSQPPPPPPPPGVGVARYTRLPRLVTAAVATGVGTGAGTPPSSPSPAALTAANLDKSAALAAVIAAPPFHGDGGAGLLAELQHAFLGFWAGQCLAGYGSWKAVLHLTLGCVAAPRDMARFYGALLTAVAAQLEASLGGGGGQAQTSETDPASAPGPFGLAMVDELLADSFLRSLFRRFYGGLARREAGLAPVPPAVRAAADRLAAVVQARLGWRLSSGSAGEGEEEEDDEDEDGPVIVDEHGNY